MGIKNRVRGAIASGKMASKPAMQKGRSIAAPIGPVVTSKINKTKSILAKVAPSLDAGTHAAIHSAPPAHIQAAMNKISQHLPRPPNNMKTNHVQDLPSVTPMRKPLGSDPSTYTPKTLLAKPGSGGGGVRRIVMSKQ